MSVDDNPSVRGAIVAAEVAIDERQLDTAEDALLLALSETRKLKQEGDG